MEKDKKYRRIGFISAVLTNVALLILFYFLIAWKEPFPPIPSYGIELSFGNTQTGQGEQAPAAPEPEEVLEEFEAAEESEVSEETETEVSEEVLEESEVAEEPLTEIESPDIVQVEEAIPKEVPNQPPPVKQEQVSQPSAAQTVLDEVPSNSQGETEGPGDEGKPDGEINDRALYGSQGGGENGASLQMAGWTWDARPTPNDPTDETGKVVFSITIDSEGYIIKIERKEGTVSPAVERIYRQSIENLSFSKTGDYKPAPTSEGTITFILQSKK